MELKRFQEKAINKILNKVKDILEENRTGTVVFQSPTGSGKTYTMANAIQTLAFEPEFRDEDFCFVWVSIGEGELHKQSYRTLKRYFNGAPEVFLLENEFSGSRNIINKNEVIVVNWDKMNMKNAEDGTWKNILMRDKETYNFPEILENTRRANRKIVLIIDESHKNTTGERAEELRDEIIKPHITIEMSATPRLLWGVEPVKVNPNDVINEGLIKKEIVINSDIDKIDDNEIDSQELVLDSAFNKRLQLKKLYEDLGIDINPLVIIQLPNSDEGKTKKEFIETYLKKKNVSTEKGNLAIWLEEEKINKESAYLIPNNSCVDFLLFKQAIGTGWDCPRAQILVKFRETKSLTFEIQTVGRILRMPEAKHYKNEILNKGYVYSNIKSIDIKKEEYNPNILKNLHSNRSQEKYTYLQLKSYYKQRLDYGNIKNSLSFYPILEKIFCDYFKLNSAEKGAFYKEKNSTLISKKINLENLTEGDEIILNKAIESTIVDTLKEIRNAETLDVKLSEDDKLLMINKLIKDNLSGFAYKRSYTPVKESLYRFFREYLCTKELENEFVYLQSIILNNYDIIANLIAQSTESYKPIKTRELEAKADNLVNWDLKWEIPISKSYNPNTYERFEATNCLYSPCYLEKDRSKPEQKFIEYLEANSQKIKWWWKNGDEHMRDNFGIQKPDSSTFQPDFLILYRDNTLGIYDTKDAGFQEDDTKIKAEALQKYIKEETLKGKNIIGGIIIVDNNDKLRVNDKETYNTFKDRPDEWSYFELT